MRRKRAFPWSILVTFVLLLALSTTASAKVKGGVILLPGAAMSEEFTSDLTEVLISALTSKADATIIGKEKLAIALEKASGATASACIESAECLKKVAGDKGLKLLVVGSVSKDGEIYNLEARRIDVNTGQSNLQIVQAKKGDIPAIIAMVKAAAEKLGELPLALVSVEANVKGAQVYIDDVPVGKTPLVEYAVDPGLHHIKIVKTGYDDYLGKFSTKAKKKYILNPKLSFATTNGTSNGKKPVVEKESSSVLGILGWTNLGVGALSLAGGGTMGYLAKKKFDDLDASCGSDAFCNITKSAAKGEAEDGEMFATASTALIITGGVLVASSIVMITLDLTSDSEPTGSTSTAYTFVPSLSPTSAGLDLVVQF
jgi:hypothetical protein